MLLPVEDGEGVVGAAGVLQCIFSVEHPISGLRYHVPNTTERDPDLDDVLTCHESRSVLNSTSPPPFFLTSLS